MPSTRGAAHACALYRRAIELEPRHVPAHLNLGAALEASGDLAGAEQAYRAGTRKAWREILMVLGVGEGRGAQQLLEDSARRGA